LFATATASIPEEIAIPRAREAVWVERLLWVFMLSFAFDYRAGEARQGGAGAGLDQMIFLLGAVSSSLAILSLGYRFLLVRPGAWFLLLWGAFLAYMISNALLQGVAPARCFRIILPLVLCFAAMANCHIAGCMGIRPSKIVAPVFFAACTNILWRIVQGLLFQGITLETSRFNLQSPGNNWLSAWIGCALLLRPKFHWTLLVACSVVFIGVAVTITRSLLFPVIVATIVATFCYYLGSRWGTYRLADFPKRLLPLAAAGMVIVLFLGICAVFIPGLLERWDERLFHLASDRNITADVSYLTRKSEIDAYFEILSRDVLHYINGKGIGATYYWHPAYKPEIRLVYDPEPETGYDMWFAGHCTWTYSLFSGGIIALCSMIALFVGIMTASLRAAAANASHPGKDQWLAYLPFIAAFALLSETITANPFEERLVGILVGMMAGLPQAFLVRASWLHSSTRNLEAASR
jgi:hypothetical protein